MVRLWAIALAFAATPTTVVTAKAETACTKAQALPLGRRATQADLSAAGIDLDARAVTLFVRFAPVDEQPSERGQARIKVNCQLAIAETPENELPHSIYVTPSKYINVRRGLLGDTIANAGFGDSFSNINVRFGHVTALSYRQNSPKSGLVSFFVQSADKTGYFVQYQLP